MRFVLTPLCIAACAAISFSRAYGEGVTAWADALIQVDSANFSSVLGVATLRCSPAWCTDAEGAEYSLSAVTNPDTANAVTSSVQVAAVEGDASYEGSGYVRFILAAEVGGVPSGNVLVKDVSFGVKSASASAVAYDNREGALQELASAGAAISLIYSSDWAEDSANLEISSVCTRHEKSGALVDITTNILLQAQCPDDGSGPFATASLGWGEYRLLLREFASDGSTVLEYLSPEFEIPHVIGMHFIIR